ncbi:MAG TPA: tetratricopeptide repeat protein, partial [Sandaracinaceae bacterium]
MPRTLAFAALVLAACGGAPARPATPRQSEVIAMEEMRIVAARRDGELVFDSYDAGQLFERGTALLNEGRCREAVERYYDRLAREFPTSRYVAPALYNAGLCLQEGGELEASVPYYQRVIERAAATRDGKHASFQLAQVLVALERWEDALTLSERILLREDLSSAERLEGMARRAQALLGLDRLDEAERQARDALSYFRTRQGDDAIADPYFAAAANFVLAETMRVRSERIEVPAADALTQHEVLDRRARLILDAQREYFSTIRFADAHWAAASGYRIGSMYDGLWHAMMEAPIPPPTRPMNEATTELYRREYRLELARHIRPLIRHAIRYWEMTLLMVERTGVRTEWAERTRADLERMRA